MYTIYFWENGVFMFLGSMCIEFLKASFPTESIDFCKLVFLGGCFHVCPGIRALTLVTFTTLIWLRSLQHQSVQSACARRSRLKSSLCAQCGDLCKIYKYLLHQRNGAKEWICSLVVTWERRSHCQINTVLVVGLNRCWVF